MGLTYEYKDISSLYNGNTQLSNESVERNTMSVLMEINYGITRRLSVSGTFTFIRKHRVTGLQNPEFKESITTSGLGDGLLVAKYAIHPYSITEPFNIALGAGLKIPFGTTSLESDGFTLNADMQPGTGAWDGVAWGYASKTFRTENITVFLQSTYRKTGTNNRFTSTDNYKFGNELVTILGVSGPVAERLSYVFQLRYRSTASDQRNGNKMPDTGGRWIQVKPGISYRFTDRMNVYVSGALPLYQHLNGIQPTTSYSLTGSLIFNFNSSKAGFIINSGE